MRIINSDYQPNTLSIPKFMLFISPQLPKQVFVQSTFSPRFIGELIIHKGIVKVIMVQSIDEIPPVVFRSVSRKLMRYLLKDKQCQDWVGSTLPAWLERTDIDKKS